MKDLATTQLISVAEQRNTGFKTHVLVLLPNLSAECSLLKTLESSSRRNHRGNGTCWLLMRLTKESALSTFERYRYSAWNAMSIVVHPLERGQMLCTARSNIRSQPQKIFVMSNILELNCWVLGDDLRSVFSVEIPSSKAVSYLKKAIKEDEKHAFNGIDADLLDLWKVSNRIRLAYCDDLIF
jgi:hypothetical protein